MRQTIYYVFYNGERYDFIPSSRQLLGTYGPNGRDYYFAAFVRSLDAIRYAAHENEGKR